MLDQHRITPPHIIGTSHGRPRGLQICTHPAHSHGGFRDFGPQLTQTNPPLTPTLPELELLMDDIEDFRSELTHPSAVLMEQTTAVFPEDTVSFRFVKSWNGCLLEHCTFWVFSMMKLSRNKSLSVKQNSIEMIQVIHIDFHKFFFANKMNKKFISQLILVSPNTCQHIKPAEIFFVFLFVVFLLFFFWSN